MSSLGNFLRKVSCFCQVLIASVYFVRSFQHTPTLNSVRGLLLVSYARLKYTSALLKSPASCNSRAASHCSRASRGSSSRIGLACAARPSENTSRSASTRKEKKERGSRRDEVIVRYRFDSVWVCAVCRRLRVGLL